MGTEIKEIRKKAAKYIFEHLKKAGVMDKDGNFVINSVKTEEINEREL